MVRGLTPLVLVYTRCVYKSQAGTNDAYRSERATQIDPRRAYANTHYWAAPVYICVYIYSYNAIYTHAMQFIETFITILKIQIQTF